MTARQLLRFLCGPLAVVQAIWFLLPFVDYRWMTGEQLTILSYGAYGAFIEFSQFAYWMYIVLFFTSLLAVYWVGARARYYFAIIVVVGVFLFVGFGGMVIEVGYSMVMRDLSNILIGGVVFLSFTIAEQPSSVR